MCSAHACIEYLHDFQPPGVPFISNDHPPRVAAGTPHGFDRLRHLAAIVRPSAAARAPFPGTLVADLGRGVVEVPAARAHVRVEDHACVVPRHAIDV